MHIDEHDIRALEKLDNIAESRVNAFIACNRKVFNDIVKDDPSRDREIVKKRLIQETIEKLHFQYWGLR